MQIEFHKSFNKAFAKLTPKQKERVKGAIALFRQNPHHDQLKNHPLHGDQKGRRAIAAGGDLRLTFKEKNNYEYVIFVRVGTHNQVY
jgi:addiction module RelE/StbE family toxin